VIHGHHTAFIYIMVTLRTAAAVITPAAEDRRDLPLHEEPEAAASSAASVTASAASSAADAAQSAAEAIAIAINGREIPQLDGFCLCHRFCRRLHCESCPFCGP
jgi:hypothetical protein